MLNNPVHERRGWQPEREGRVRGDACLGRVGLIFGLNNNASEVSLVSPTPDSANETNMRVSQLTGIGKRCLKAATQASETKSASGIINGLLRTLWAKIARVARISAHAHTTDRATLNC